MMTLTICLNDDAAVDVDDPFSYNDAVDAGSLFNNDDTVNNDDAVDGSYMFDNDDAVDGSDMFNDNNAVSTSDLFSNDDAIDLNVEVDEQPRELLYEIWAQILSHVISQSDFLWPDHKCRLFCRIRSVNGQLYQNQKSGKRAVSVQRLIKRFGSYSGVIWSYKELLNLRNGTMLG